MALVFGEDSESTFIRTTVHDTIRTPTTTSAQGVVVRRSQLSTIPTKPIRLVKDILLCCVSVLCSSD